MKHLYMLIFLILLNIKCKTWRKLPEHLPTLFYVTFFNVVYYFICQKKLVWDFRSDDLPIKKVRILQVFFSTPLLAHLYLTLVPPKLRQSKGKFLILFSLGSTLFEWLSNKRLRMISFFNGWNIRWSLLIYFQMYFYSYLHKKYPLQVWVISLLSLEHYVQVFRIPLSIKMFSPLGMKKFFYSTFLE